MRMGFPGRVKQVVKKMHGLNTNVDVRYLTPATYNYGVGAPYATFNYYFNTSSPGNLRARIPALLDSPDLQFYVKRMYTRNTFTNVSLQNVMVDITKLYARRDIRADVTLAEICNDEVVGTSAVTVPLIQMPYVSFTVGDTFRKTFKVLSHKQRILKPLSTVTIKDRIQKSYLRKPINQDVEADTQYSTRRGNILTIVRFYGTPTNWTNSVGVGTNITGLTPVIIRGIQNTYTSYYRMDDAEPTALFTNNAGFTTVGVTGNTTWNPTYAMLVANAGWPGNGSVPNNAPLVHAQGPITPPS